MYLPLTKTLDQTLSTIYVTPIQFLTVCFLSPLQLIMRGAGGTRVLSPKFAWSNSYLEIKSFWLRGIGLQLLR